MDTIEKVKEQLQQAISTLYGITIPIEVWYDKTRRVYVSNVAFKVSKVLTNQK